MAHPESRRLESRATIAKSTFVD